ncbi:MAG TPA: OB-fold domain-containing protein [Novosphingobium sp.]|nr:OB-fold domain-containing protein [Novosphingobium sp.]HMP57279.1 OB-fold domain-containing protein [Novosphingobium sp.]
MTARVLPLPDGQSTPFWEACSRHELALPRCGACGLFTLPPDLTCPHCHSTEPAWTFQPVMTGGRVRTWTVMRHSFLQGFDLPAVLVDVELDQQADLRLIGRLVDGPDVPLVIGARVSVVFEDIGEGFSLPCFKLEHAA